MKQLNNSNYFSPENTRKYMGVSQFKDFVGTLHGIGCQATAMAKINGEMPELFAPSTPMLVGSYVDAYFEGELLNFKANNPSIFTLKGELRSEYKTAEEVIKTAENDEYFMAVMEGEKQTIMTAEIFGVEWKIKIDSYKENTRIVDLKVMKAIYDKHWSTKQMGYVNFIDFYGYDIQGAIYQEVVYRNTGKRLPFFIAALTKESVPDKAIIHIDNLFLNQAMSFVEENINMVKMVKNGEMPPVRCEKCDYCKATKKLSGVINYENLLV